MPEISTYVNSLSSATLTGTEEVYLASDEKTTAQDIRNLPTTNYVIWRGLISQSGTSAPTAIVLENTLGGTITFAYLGVGAYSATLVGAFTADKTFLIPNNVTALGAFTALRSTTDVVNLYTSDSVFAPVNGALTKAELQIIVYP